MFYVGSVIRDWFEPSLEDYTKWKTCITTNFTITDNMCNRHHGFLINITLVCSLFTFVKANRFFSLITENYLLAITKYYQRKERDFVIISNSARNLRPLDRAKDQVSLIENFDIWCSIEYEQPWKQWKLILCLSHFNLRFI